MITEKEIKEITESFTEYNMDDYNIVIRFGGTNVEVFAGKMDKEDWKIFGDELAEKLNEELCTKFEVCAFSHKHVHLFWDDSHQ